MITTFDNLCHRVGTTTVLATMLVATILLMLFAGEARAAQQTISTPAETFSLNQSTDGEVRDYSWAIDGKLWRITGNSNLRKDIDIPGNTSQIRLWAGASAECGVADIGLNTRKWTNGTLEPAVRHGARNAIANQMSWLEWNVNLPAGNYRVSFQRECTDATVVYEDHVEVVYEEAQPQEQPCNLQQKIDAASSGDVIDGAGCVERSRVVLSKPLTLKNMTIQGSDNWSGDFTASGDNFVSAKTLPIFDEPTQTRDENNLQLCEGTNASCAWVEQVFVDGKYLTQSADGADPGSGQFALDAGRRVVLGSDPAGKKVEVSTRQEILSMQSGSGGSVFDNVTFTHAANYRAFAAVKNNGNNLTVRNSEVSWAHGSGMTAGGLAAVEVTGSTFANNGTVGFGTHKANPLIFDSNVARDNCTLPDAPYNDSFECSGIKITGESPGSRTISGSSFYGNDHSGVWTDVDANNVEIFGNRIHHNHSQGMHIEISNNITIRDNVLYENGWIGTPGTTFNSADVYNSDSGNVKVYRNVMAWSRDGYAYIGGTRNPTNLGNEVYDNDIILDANDAGNKQILSGWLLNGDNLGSNIAHDNRYYYGGLQDANATKKFQWNTTLYAKLADYNATLGAERGRFLSATEVQSVLQANNVPATPEH